VRFACQYCDESQVWSCYEPNLHANNHPCCQNTNTTNTKVVGGKHGEQQRARGQSTNQMQRRPSCSTNRKNVLLSVRVCAIEWSVVSDFGCAPRFDENRPCRAHSQSGSNYIQQLSSHKEYTTNTMSSLCSICMKEWWVVCDFGCAPHFDENHPCSQWPSGASCSQSGSN